MRTLLGGSWYLGHFRGSQVGYKYSYIWLVSTMNLQVHSLLNAPTLRQRSLCLAKQSAFSSAPWVSASMEQQGQCLRQLRSFLKTAKAEALAHGRQQMPRNSRSDSASFKQIQTGKPDVQGVRSRNLRRGNLLTSAALTAPQRSMLRFLLESAAAPIPSRSRAQRRWGKRSPSCHGLGEVNPQQADGTVTTLLHIAT